MLVKILNADDEVTRQLMRQTGFTVASKAYEYAGSRYCHQVKEIIDLQEQIRQLEQKYQAALQVIEGARSAAAHLLEKTAQGDLL